MAKTILIVTGPQGSGNHLWSKIFALHPQVQGWSALLDEYWIGHDEEPWVKYWRNPDLLKNYNWTQADYYVTSISVPYMDNGTATIPNIVRFAACAMGAGVKVQIAVVGRDRNILNFQETRVRGLKTYTQAIDEYAKLTTFDPAYLSYELLHLYQSNYLAQLSQQLNFPIAHDDLRLSTILQEDTNSKYFCPVDEQHTDMLAKHASRKKQ